jgi:hypothetical protein
VPYCTTTLKAEHAEDVINLISRIAIEHFRAREAYPLESGEWNIDAGENDVRAIHRDNNGIIRFFCRYESDIQPTEKKINDFASNHPDECKSIATA